MILYIISSVVQFLVEPLSSTGCQCTTSAVLVSFTSFKESGGDHMWTVLFFFHGVVQRHLLIILTAVSALSLIVFLFIFFLIG